MRQSRAEAGQRTELLVGSPVWGDSIFAALGYQTIYTQQQVEVQGGGRRARSCHWRGEMARAPPLSRPAPFRPVFVPTATGRGRIMGTRVTLGSSMQQQSSAESLKRDGRQAKTGKQTSLDRLLHRRADLVPTTRFVNAASVTLHNRPESKQPSDQGPVFGPLQLISIWWHWFALLGLQDDIPILALTTPALLLLTLLLPRQTTSGSNSTTQSAATAS